MESFRSPDGKFFFHLVYPDLLPVSVGRNPGLFWKQTTNPLTVQSMDKIE
jgi:hypothetical protein